MMCENSSCHSEASVMLTKSVSNPTWFCPYCASKLLTNASFKTLKELPLIQQYEGKKKSCMLIV